MKLKIFQDSTVKLLKYDKFEILIGALFTGVIFALFAIAGITLTEDIVTKIIMIVVLLIGIGYPFSVYRIINGRSTYRD